MADTPTAIATEVLALVIDTGARLDISDDKEIATVSFWFEPGDSAAYVTAENNALRILSRIPANRPGTVWGTDSGSVGGHAGFTGGYCRMNKSGIAKRPAAVILKAIRQTEDALIAKVNAR